MTKPATLHSITRTSPKGGKFIGTCRLCGQEGLTLADMDKTCPNMRGLSQDDALIEVVGEGQFDD